MVAFNKVQGFVGYLGTGAIDLNADTFKAYATNATPSASADDVLLDLADITAENGYSAGGSDVTNLYSEAAGTGTMTATDITWTASGGTFGPFRYIGLYDDTVTTPVIDPLAGWWDYGSAITPADPETFTIDFGASLATLV